MKNNTKKVPQTTTRENLAQRNSTMLAIDAAKFDEKVLTALKKEGYTNAGFSKECGYGPQYMTNIMYNRVISRQMMSLIEMKLGIKYDEYKWIEPKKEESKKEESKKEESKELTELIQTCVKVLNGIEYELISIGRKLDDLKVSSELNTDLINDIKDNTSRIKPYATLTKEQD